MVIAVIVEPEGGLTAGQLHALSTAAMVPQLQTKLANVAPGLKANKRRGDSVHS